ncbi:M60 family metallopeptidase [Aureibaculum conchae]|uniref:M60 family metallopeptidase n=1 Tax=Aureibaculum sp. 2308TA14-22 TaxID=3108392 RepID=UPI003398BF91
MKKYLYNYLILFTITFFVVFGSCNKDDAIAPSIPTNQIPKELAVDSVQTFNQITSSDNEISRLGLRFNFTDFQPTGVYVKSNSTLKLNVTLQQGTQLPQLLVGTYSHSDNWNHQPLVFDLQEGDNSFQIGNDGLVYINYTDYSNPNGKVQIKFTDGWKHSPVYTLNKTSSATWKKMLDYFKDVPSATLISNKAILVVTREKAIEYQNENQENLLKSIDETIELYNELSGMDNSTAIHKPMFHKLLMAEYTGSDYYMFAYYYRTAYSTSGVQYILSEKEFKEDGWGPWHEIGHMYQMNAWTWNEVGETTVNIYSLASEKAKGITTSRMKRENRWGEITTYLALSDTDRSFNSDKASVWVRLGMFYQLHLAFGDDFYKILHKAVREENQTINNDEDRMRTFMIHACKASNKDLTAFFKKWGLKFSGVENVYTQIQDLGLSTPSEDLTLLTD